MTESNKKTLSPRRAKIIATLGPSTSEEEAIESLLKAGVDVVRLNFSHGDHAFFRILVNRVRAVSARLGKTVGILQDLQGPKIRTGLMKGGQIQLHSGEETIVTTEEVLGTAERFSTQYKLFPKEISVGDVVLLDDGKLAIRVKKILGNFDVLCDVIHGGVLRSKKGINLPGSKVAMSSLTEKDLKDLRFGAELGVDAVALSFVREAEDIHHLRRELAQSKSRPLLIAKLEKPQAIDALEEILDASDGVMVARGDLGVEIPPERVPIVQKDIIDKAVRRGKFVIVATQMLESMIVDPRPTRAEASDVANAVLDGADLLMMSAETASGDYPIKAVEFMDRIIRHAEESDMAFYELTDMGLETKAEQTQQNAASLAGVRAAAELDSKAIVIYTTSGATARLVSHYRPKTPLIAFVPNAAQQRRLAFAWGIQTEIIQHPMNIEDLIEQINERLLARGLNAGDTVAVLTKIPLLSSQRTNTVYVHTVSHGHSL